MIADQSHSEYFLAECEISTLLYFLNYDELNFQTQEPKLNPLSSPSILPFMAVQM